MREHFFPRWDRGGWQVIQVDDLDGAEGHCNREKKTIRIVAGKSGNALSVLLIHEIVHAVTEECHGKRWFRRMEQAADEAAEQGLKTLARLIHEEIAGYKDGWRPTASSIYRQIENCVREQPGFAFEQVMDHVRRDWGLSREDFLRRFRRANRIFEETKREERESAERRAQLRAGSATTLSRTPVADAVPGARKRRNNGT